MRKFALAFGAVAALICFWQDAATAAPVVTPTPAFGFVAPGQWLAMRTIPAGNTVANTTDETTFISGGRLPATFWSPAGRFATFYAAGVFSTSGAPTLQFRLYQDASVIADFTAATVGTDAANAGWEMRVPLSCSTTGSTGTLEVQGLVFYDNTGATAVNFVAAANTTTFAVNTQTAHIYSISVDWSAAAAGNTVTLRQAWIEAGN